MEIVWTTARYDWPRDHRKTARSGYISAERDGYFTNRKPQGARCGHVSFSTRIFLRRDGSKGNASSTMPRSDNSVTLAVASTSHDFNSTNSSAPTRSANRAAMVSVVVRQSSGTAIIVRGSVISVVKGTDRDQRWRLGGKPVFIGGAKRFRRVDARPIKPPRKDPIRRVKQLDADPVRFGRFVSKAIQPADRINQLAASDNHQRFGFGLRRQPARQSGQQIFFPQETAANFDYTSHRLRSNVRCIMYRAATA